MVVMGEASLLECHGTTSTVCLAAVAVAVESEAGDGELILHGANSNACKRVSRRNFAEW
jgi:hypothetical protein